jgi:hypothetical protein
MTSFVAFTSTITKVVAGFTKRYSVGKPVWFEIYDDAAQGGART